MADRKYKWADPYHIESRIIDATVTLMSVAAIGWLGDKVFKISLSPDPSTGVINFIKMSASVSASNMFLDYIDKKHII